MGDRERGMWRLVALVPLAGLPPGTHPGIADIYIYLITVMVSLKLMVKGRSKENGIKARKTATTKKATSKDFEKS